MKVPALAERATAGRASHLRDRFLRVFQGRWCVLRLEELIHNPML